MTIRRWSLSTPFRGIQKLDVLKVKGFNQAHTTWKVAWRLDALHFTQQSRIRDELFRNHDLGHYHLKHGPRLESGQDQRAGLLYVLKAYNGIIAALNTKIISIEVS